MKKTNCNLKYKNQVVLVDIVGVRMEFSMWYAPKYLIYTGLMAKRDVQTQTTAEWSIA